MVRALVLFFGVLIAAALLIPTADLKAWQTALSSLVGFIGVILALVANAWLARLESQRSEALKLKLQIYEGILKTCESASNAIVELTGYVRSLVQGLAFDLAHQAVGVSVHPPAGGYDKLSELRTSVSSAAIAVVTTVEQWSIVDIRMTVFQTAINVALYDFGNAFQEYVPRAAPYMQAPGGTDRWRTPTEAAVADVKRVSERVTDTSETLLGYVHDFQIEMQNLLVGDLFGNRVPPRSPLDPRHRVITLDRHEELQRYFETETAWGHSRQQTTESVLGDLPT